MKCMELSVAGGRGTELAHDHRAGPTKSAVDAALLTPAPVHCESPRLSPASLHKNQEAAVTPSPSHRTQGARVYATLQTAALGVPQSYQAGVPRQGLCPSSSFPVPDTSLC